MQSDPSSLALARRARTFFLVLGSFFAGLSLLLFFVRALASPAYAPIACAVLAVVFLVIWRFATNQWIVRCQNLLTGWP